ncbi:ABC transporter permease [Flavihumibacter stibioxidans]|uniref:ABC transporter permease n=1 Tax=Flavihumibacter stibioxidans TaxID=1834163 RepID=A0ABR7MAJ2_9BACT|nr:ABC transporter permease [Flavihumibacter stibioxidans]MBC6491992.1 hypothetical protein [Flavihumibacter stibioxidans]
MIYLRMAWRNIWRNARRTWITVASIFFAVILATLMFSLLEGVYVNMIRNVVSFSTGYLQVHEKGYWEDKSIEHVFTADSASARLIENTDGITAMVPRIENFALASTGNQTSGAMVLGIDPEKENTVTGLKSKLSEGNYLGNNSRGAMIGSGLARKLRLSVGDTMILLSQGYHAGSANGLFRVDGILKMNSPDLDKVMVYLSLPRASELFGLENQYSSWALMIRDDENMEAVKLALQQRIDSTRFEVMDWKGMMPELDQMIEADSTGHRITIYILYMVISFGIFSTILMMLAERKHEFGIMLAIGMKKHQLAFIVFLETVIISFLGVLVGTAGALPVIHYLSRNPIQLQGDLKVAYESYGFEPIMPVSTAPEVFITQSKVVLIITMLVAIYPIIQLLRMRLMTALRS